MTEDRILDPRARDDHGYRLAGLVALPVLLVLLTAGAIMAFDTLAATWVPALFTIFAIAIANPYKEIVSDRERFYSFSIAAGLLAISQLESAIVPALVVWGLAELIAVTINERSVWVGALVALPGLPVGAAALGVRDLLDQGGAPLVVQALGMVVVYFPAALVAHAVVPVLVLGASLGELATSIVWSRLGFALLVNLAVAGGGVLSGTALNEALPELSIEVGSLVVTAVLATAFFGIAMRRRAKQSGDRLTAVLSAASALPWPADQDPLRRTVQYVREAVVADRVEVRSAAPDGRNEIGAPLRSEGGDDLYVVARRRAGRNPFGRQDIETVSAIAHMGMATARIQSEAHDLEMEANTDLLTKLPNYRAFQIALARANSARPPGSALAVVYIDLDNFKSINDLHGHEAGNQVLVTFASRLRRVVRPTDVVARVGGDEFVIILTDVSSEKHATAVAERIARAISAPVTIGETILALTVSTGIAFSDTPSTDPDALVQEADQRMYSARGRALRPNAEAVPSASPDLADVTALVAQAIRGGGLMVHYQPIVDNVENTVINLEALVRLGVDSPVPVPAMVLVHEARRLGLLDRLTGEVVRAAVAELDPLLPLLPGFQGVAVNIEVDQVLSEEFRTLVEQAVHDHPEVKLYLEMTEASLNRNSVQVLAALQELREDGVSLALDDFGQAYSTFLSVVQYPFDTLKVDQAMIRNLEDVKTQQVIRSLAMLARKLDFRMVVEGVETAQQREQLTRLGVRYMQGYLFGRPMPATALEERLREHGPKALLSV